MNSSNPYIPSPESMTKTFWRFAIPSIAAMIVNGLYQIVDGMFVGHFIGYQGLAAINMAWPLLSIVAGIGIMIGMGGGSLVSIYRGESHHQKPKLVLSTNLWLFLWVGIAVSIVLYFFGVNILLLQGAEQETLRLGSEYISIYVWGSIFTIASAALPILIRNDNSPNFATILMVIGALVNIVLDYLFIGLWKWELQGAAIATLISQTTVVVISLGYFFLNMPKLV